jgi:hypothetical protein
LGFIQNLAKAAKTLIFGVPKRNLRFLFGQLRRPEKRQLLLPQSKGGRRSL